MGTQNLSYFKLSETPQLFLPISAHLRTRAWGCGENAAKNWKK